MKCQKWVHEYTKWINNNVEIQETDMGCLVTTPFLSIDNDYITLRIEENGNEITIGDNYYTFEYLFLHDYDLDKKRMKNLEQLMNGLGLSIENNEIVAKTNLKDFGRMFSNVIHGVNKACSLVNTIRATEQKTFRDEIRDYFNELNVSFTSSYKIRGKSTDHYFDFMIFKGDILLIDPLSTKSISTARKITQSLAFKLLDVKGANYENTMKGIAILDDSHEHIWENEDIKNILDNYVDSAYKWNKERNLIKKLVA